MTRTTGQILLLTDDEPELGALELALLQRGANVHRAEPEAACRLLDRNDLDLILVDPERVDSRAAAILDTAPLVPWLVALVPDAGTATLRRALSVGARDFLCLPIDGSADREADRLMELVRERRLRCGSRGIKEADSYHRLKQHVRELTDRYLRQCRTSDEAQDVFYLDLSRLMTILDNIMDGIVFTDPEGQITLMNPVAEALVSVKTIFAIGKSIRDLGPGIELVEEIARDHERALIEGGVSERTLEIHLSGRDLSYLQLRTTAVTDYKGSFAGILTVIKDVSAEFKSEQMKNQYLSIVSHELRTPLTGIKTLATILGKGMLGGLPAQQQEVVNSIREQALRLEHEVDKLISLGRIESGDLATDREAFPVVELLDSAVAPFRQIAQDRGLDFLVEDDDAGPWVLADREDLRRAIQALVENSIKFTPAGGRVEVFVEELEDSVKLHVKDNGPGINPRYHRSIFEKFFQIENPLTRHHGGAGLGLALAQGVARAHNGWIELFSDIGQGADFCICLPKCDGDSGGEVETSQAAVAAIRKEE